MNSCLHAFLKNMQIMVSYALESDYHFNKREFRKRLHYDPSFSEPKTFSEKLQYLKMHYYNPLQTICADKVAVCEYVKECGYPEILKDIYQVCEKPDEIDLSLMPDRFFIQCSHTQGNNFIVSKDDIDTIRQIKSLYRIILKRKHYKVLRENCYRGIKPKIICSELLEQTGTNGLIDYKIYCFGGKAKYLMVSYGELDHAARNHKFDMSWNSIDHLFKDKESIPAVLISKPKNFDKMVEIAERLADPFPHVRVDLYNIRGRIIFGEMTFYSAGGFVKIASEEMALEIGSWIKLENYREWMVKQKHARFE